jgi:KDO2-lipid IV(A) lauroyltransferase
LPLRRAVWTFIAIVRPMKTFAAHLLWLLLKLLGMLPLALLHRIGDAFAWLWRVLPTRERRVARRNIELCLPELAAAERQLLLRQTLRAAGHSLFELPWFWTRPLHRVLASIRRIEGLAIFQRAIDEGRGVLLAAPHLGAWEILNLWLATHSRLAVLYRPPRKPFLETVFNRGRARAGALPIRAQASGVRQLVKHLRSGGVMGILPDQQPKQGEGDFATFFGQQALTMTLFPKLAASQSVAVILAFAERLPRGRGFVLHFRRADPAITDVATLNANIEACARLLPAQYQWTYKRFSMQPEGRRTPY